MQLHYRERPRPRQYSVLLVDTSLIYLLRLVPMKRFFLHSFHIHLFSPFLPPSLHSRSPPNPTQIMMSFASSLLSFTPSTPSPSSFSSPHFTVIRDHHCPRCGTARTMSTAPTSRQCLVCHSSFHPRAVFLRNIHTPSAPPFM